MPYIAWMELAEVAARASRVIEVGADAASARSIVSQVGSAHYLGLVRPDRLAAARAAAPELADRFHPLESAIQITENNAEILLLRHPYQHFVGAALKARRAVVVATELRSSTAGPVSHAVATNSARLACRLTAAPHGSLEAIGLLTAGPSQFVAVKVARRRTTTRRFASQIGGPGAFLEALDRGGIRYTVLRWFETLPRLEPGEDLDLLVDDDDLPAVEALLDDEPGTIPVDLYSVSGRPGSDFRGSAYYQPDLARRILDRAVAGPSGHRVPSPEDHLHSLAYHAVYHKGLRSGVPSVDGARDPRPEHDYGSLLEDLAGRLGEPLPRTLEELDNHLAAVGWRPTTDALRRLSIGNPWLAEHLGPTVDGSGPGPAVFLLRERALAVVGPEELSAMLESLGFEVLVVHELSREATERCLTHARGGNWDRGPFPVSGGAPAVAVVGLHYGPRHPTVGEATRYPHLSNADTLAVKLRVRALVDERVPATERFNPLHSSDNAAEAWEYVDLALPAELAASIRATVADRLAAWRDPAGTRRVLSVGRRARVVVVDHGQGPVVRKTYAPPFVRLKDREVAAMRGLAGHPAIPPVLAEGPTWFETPWYRDRMPAVTTGRRATMLPLHVVRQMVAVLADLNDAGWDLVDAKPGNFVLDDSGLHVIDFEFARHRTGSPPPLAETIAFTGRPPEPDGDLPVSDLCYEQRWQYATGLPQAALLGGSVLEQRVHRLSHRVHVAWEGPVGLHPMLGRWRRRGTGAVRRGVLSYEGRRALRSFRGET
jgi:hypothetical protein